MARVQLEKLVSFMHPAAAYPGVVVDSSEPHLPLNREMDGLVAFNDLHPVEWAFVGFDVWPVVDQALSLSDGFAGRPVTQPVHVRDQKMGAPEHVARAAAAMHARIA